MYTYFDSQPTYPPAQYQIFFANNIACILLLCNKHAYALVFISVSKPVYSVIK